MRIHALSADKGGCNYYRIRVPLMSLRGIGHQTSWGLSIEAAELDDLDVLVVQLLNGPTDLEQLEYIAHAPVRRRPLIVYEVDDDLFTLDQVASASSVWGRPDTNERLLKYFALADLMTVTTPYLANLYRPYVRRVAVLPNCVPDWLCDVPSPEPEHFTVGWTCSPSHLADAQHIIDALDRFMARYPGARFRWIGPKEVPGSPWADRQECVPWVGNVNEYLLSLAGTMSVGIAPLGPFPFNKGKSGLKALEYGALGVPTVAADWPQYRDVIRDGRTGYLAHSKSDWPDYLGRLYTSHLTRRRIGEAARTHIRAHHTITANRHRWANAYQEAINARD